MESALDWHQAKALLEWYVELGVSEAVSDTPINRYELAPEPPKPAAAPQAAKQARPAPVVAPQTDWVAKATEAAGAAKTLEDLSGALQAFEGSSFKKGARNFIFADGNPAARVMIIGDIPRAEEERAGKPFAGPEAQLLAKMFNAIGMSLEAPASQNALYITSVSPWRVPGDRRPKGAEIEVFRPFLTRHIEIVAPDIVVLMGTAALVALTDRTSIARARGQWAEIAGRPALPMLHPNALIRDAAMKREAWADLLSLQAKLREIEP